MPDNNFFHHYTCTKKQPPRPRSPALEKPGRMKRLAARLRDPEFAAQFAAARAERMKIINARHLGKSAADLERAERRQYAAAVENFGETEDCSPDAVIYNPLCIQLARRFNKTPEQVAQDINRHYLASYQPLEAGPLDLLDDEDK
jgi:hypothetical protein